MVVSIITPLYKVEDFIARCADSLFRQSYTEIEYIFVDDCSSDRSVEVLLQVAERYPQLQQQIRILHHESNRGVAAARETGLAAATGEYVYWVDADDWIEPDAIEKMVVRSEQGQKDIIACGWYLCFRQNERRMPMPCYADAETALRGMLSGTMRWNLWLYMIKRDLYLMNDIHFMEGENVGEDMLVLIKLFSHAKSIGFVKDAFYHYVKQNENSLTRLSPEQQMKRQMRNLQAATDYLVTHFIGKYEKEINFFKLNAKMPLLISNDKNSYRTWTACFPEANKYIMANKRQTLRMRLVQLMVAKRQFWLVELYYQLVFKFVYGILYK